MVVTYFTEDTATSKGDENRFTIVRHNTNFSAFHNIHLTSNITFPTDVISWAENLRGKQKSSCDHYLHQ